MIHLGRVEGAEAAEWNMIHRAVPEEELDAAVTELVTTLAKSATVGLGLAKWLLHVGATTPLDEHLRNEAFAMELSSRSEDFREGLKAFGEKRPPEFGGRWGTERLVVERKERRLADLRPARRRHRPMDART